MLLIGKDEFGIITQGASFFYPATVLGLEDLGSTVSNTVPEQDGNYFIIPNTAFSVFTHLQSCIVGFCNNAQF